MDDVLLGIFREESIERMDRMGATLHAAEAGGGDSGTIAQLFRETHSIKGSAGMFGLDAIAGLAGAIEDVLDRSRERNVLAPQAIPAMLAAVDAIRAAVTDHPEGVEAAAAGLRALGGETNGFRRAPVAPSTPGARAGRTAAPPTLRVRAEKVDSLLASVGETGLHRRRIERLSARTGPADEALQEELDHGKALIDELRDGVLDLRMLPLQTITAGLTRAVRAAAAEVGREVELKLVGTTTPLDRVMLDGISDALVHLLRNAVAHGIEPPDEREALGKPRAGTVTICAEQRGGLVALTCADDGRGVPAGVLASVPAGGSLADVLAKPGFSTAGELSELSGRGVGLDAVKAHVETLGGVLQVTSLPGTGTTVSMLVPLTLAVVTVLLVKRGGQVFGIPVSGVDRVLGQVDEQHQGGRRAFELEGVPVPLHDLADTLGMHAPSLGPSRAIVVLESGTRRAAVECDELGGHREVVVKSLGPLLSPLARYLGAAILGDGAVALLLDPAQLVRSTDAVTLAGPPATNGAAARAPTVLVVDDELTVRELARTILEAAGYVVITAEDGLAALAVLDGEDDVACVVTDVEMPRMGGLDLLEAIRTRPGGATIPVVIVSSRDDAPLRQRGTNAGADAWIVKSRFEQQALLQTIGNLIGAR